MTSITPEWFSSLVDCVSQTDDWKPFADEICNIGNERIKTGKVSLKSDFLIDDFEKEVERRRLIRFWTWFDNSPYSIDVDLAIPLRYNLAKKLFRSIGKNVILSSGISFKSGKNITIGDDVYIGEHVIFDDECPKQKSGCINIGSRCGIGEGVKIFAHIHGKKDLTKEVGNPVIIQNDVVLYSSVVILPGCTIQKRSIVNTGSVVHKSCESYSLLSGNPAKKIGDVPNTETNIERKTKQTWDKIIENLKK